MNPAKKKGDVIGSITIHINSKFRISHVDIIDDGDLVKKRTIQDSLMLIFNAIAHSRARRKQSGLVVAADKGKTVSRDSDKLAAYKKRRQKERDADDAKMLESIMARKEEVEADNLRAKAKIRPGYMPILGVSEDEARAEAKKGADAMVAALVKDKKSNVVKSITKKKETK